MILLKNVLVATDFGEAADAALDYGRDLARSFDAKLHVLNVAENLLGRSSIEMYPAFGPDLQNEVAAAAQTHVDALLSAEDRTRLRAQGVIRISNVTAKAIVDYAKEATIDIIVMGTHGRGAVSQVFMGSVAERVVRTAPCPVLTVRQPERDFLVPDVLVATALA